MFEMLIAPARYGKTVEIKKRVEKLLKDRKKVCVFLFDRELSGFDKTRWRKDVVKYEDLNWKELPAFKKSLTLITFDSQKLLYGSINGQSSKRTLSLEFLHAIRDRFDAVFIDDGRYLLKHIVKIGGFTNLVDFMNVSSQTDFVITFQSLIQTQSEKERIQAKNKKSLLGYFRVESKCPECGNEDTLHEYETRKKVHCQRCYHHHDYKGE